MNLPPPRVFESLHFNHANANSITSPTFLHHQPLVGGNYIMETRVETLGDVCDGKSNSNLEEAFKLSNCTTHENHPHFKLDNLECNSSITSGGVSSGTPSSTESAIINLEGDECMNKSTPSSPLSIAENGSFYASLNGCGFNHCIGNSDVDHTNMEVVLHPDYVVYQDNYYTGTKLCFSQCYIQISDSTACAKQGEGTFEWAVDDLIHIDCLLFPKSGMVVMKLCAVSSNAGPSNHISCTSDIEELKIVFVDDNWSLRQEQITSLNGKYLAIWNTVSDFQESFEKVDYPKGDLNSVCITKSDFDLLKPDTFINDTIIDFYIQYLKSKIQKEESHRYHFFNSFFFRKLVDMDRNPSSASDGKAAFQRVRRWTRKVNLFEKDYIFIPVNFKLHWSLIVICHPGEVVKFNDKEPDKALKVPCVLHMDSMRGYHSDLKNIFQSYLWEEWKERQKDTCGEDLSSRFLNMHFLSVPSPQQDNMFDCGLFLLHCIELFLDEAPFNFNPFKLTKFSNFLNLDWFHPVEVSLKRPFIQRLIFELAENENHSLHEGFPSDYNEDHRYSENNKNRTNSLRPEVNGDSSLSHSVQGKQFTLLSAPSPLDPQSFNPSDMVLKEHFKPGTMAGTSLGHCQSLDQQSSDHYLNGSIFSTKDGTDLNEELMHIMANPNFQQVSPQSFSLTYLTGGCETEISHGPRIGIQSEHDKIESFIATPSCASGDSDIEIIENFPTRNETRSSYEDERGENNNTAIENYIEQVSDIPGSLMENSQWPNTNCVGHNNGDQHLSYIQSEHSKTKPSQATSTCAYASDDIAMIGNFPIINETRSPYEDEQGEKNNTAIEDYFEHFPEIPDSHMEFSQWPNTSTYASANPDNIAITESFPIRNETGLSYDDQRAEYNNAAMENFFEHLPEIPDSLVEFSQRSNPMCVSDNNGDQGLYCQETPAMQMDQVSNALDDKFTCDDDDLVIIDSMEPDHWKNQPIKKRRMLR
ncbi:putative ubiquitin-like-specific protease 2B [Glycine soja]